ncbi:hypothetical protein N5P37_000588 [Trichoderma harzianum]|uniref:2EXR domain-containing protein n=1 Tax=Trichoderma harzianum CBS 226.95 TaxID=983964 RepID=A0A2T4AI90_TRIHA|nr:hypothetical protein M431DRAFT_493241 [Trichoderma harzianum CBS 226.95]KAK0766859.1 hypothetical protein N5P37_000588 [Trichoderma harzianum]PKK46065.1 hypothetical protein CI102_9758 [Trichoderma harzianum]PTB56767.1 hypothetical protein M431DRAFT_493241 [Trichoderma harzianum CBS 226.95]
MATTFHPFPRLPSEIRSQIWALAVYPRLLHIRITPKKDTLGNSYLHYASMIPQAELMHVCRESRQLAPYRKAFFTTLPGDSEARYIWVNFDEDMISLQDEKLRGLAPHAAEIQRLRFTVPTGSYREYWEDLFHRFPDTHFKMFTALRELHFALSEGYGMCGYANYGTCHPDNVRYVNVHTGWMLTEAQVEMVDEWAWRKGGLVEDMDNFDRELEWVVDNAITFIEDCAEVD